ncbi:MAG TPA: DUF86 domain-containing protein [Aggregatilineales bacterium]|jgi:uncharacterized protein with HEPN domain|nr:DUF86 domain-containing protein [Aggregatilineales bacterium]
MRSDEALLLDMLIAARRIQRFTDGMTLNDFNHSEVVQSAVLREIQVIGEAGRRVSDVTRARHVHVPWAAISECETGLSMSTSTLICEWCGTLSSRTFHH